MKELTPLMKQYHEIKDKYNDYILFFRLGDFYEMFGDDARVASKILSIALTTRDKNSENPMPMCGIPYFSSEPYIKKLINAGYKVAVSEQIEDSKEAKGIVKREVVRVITPGTFEPDNPKENSYILSFFPKANIHGYAIADISTGDFIVYESSEALYDEINRFDPKEILCPDTFKTDISYMETLKRQFTSFYEDYYFDFNEAYRILLEFFKVSTLDGFGCEGMDAAISAAGALISYLTDTQKSSLSFNKLRILNVNSYMFLDSVTRNNLEILSNIKDSTSNETLLWILDETLTPMGGRYLRDAILKPLIEKDEIEKRLSAIEAIYEHFELRENIRVHLKTVQDLERLTSRIVRGNANARDLIAIKNSVIEVLNIKDILQYNEDNYLNYIYNNIHISKNFIEIIDSSIIESPPNTIKDGGIIKEGYNQEIDELREISKKGKTFLTELEIKERKKTGINSLKIGYNRVFGYYIEVTKPNLHMVSDNYIRKQTLTNAERFITQELKDYENKILGAEERLKNIEYHVFKEVTEKLIVNADDLRKTANSIAMLDFLQSLSTVAKKNNYIKPVIHNNGEININEGRHPVIERLFKNEPFIPNDAQMDLKDNKILIITGPNMAGKSTYMRQIALIVLMAQIGSFIPADYAEIGIVDRIFTRIGASDYLAKGQSTFMVEMIETANILNNATDRSLILLDEVGRGTSTFDGISIAWAVAEHIANDLKTRTLFATHYNELTELSLSVEGVKNYNVSVKEWGDEIIFLRKIVRGSADKSYGIHVARLAGLPYAVMDRAREILANLEKEELSDTGEPKFALRKKRKVSEQLDLFAGMTNPAILRLSQLNVDKITPDEALREIKELRNLVKE